MAVEHSAALSLDDLFPAAEPDLDELFAEPAPAPLALVEPTEVLPAAADDEPDQDTRLKAVEEELYETNLRICQDTTRFCEVAFDAVSPPEAWIRELGVEGAWKRFRVAKGAQMAAKDAPVGIQMAGRIVSGLAKARAMERSEGSKALNVQIVLMPQVHTYQAIEVAGREDDA